VAYSASRRFGLNVVAVACFVVLVAGIAIGVGVAQLWLPHPVSPVNAATPSENPSLYRCRGNEVPAAVLNTPAPSSELDPDVRDILSTIDATGLTDVHPWIVVSRTAEDVKVIRSIKPIDPDPLNPQIDHQLIEATRASADGPWSIGQNTLCALSRDLTPLTVLSVQLDPRYPITRESTVIQLLVRSDECGKPTDIQTVQKIESDTRVALIIAALPATGAQTCIGLPPMPFTVTLDKPIGTRVLIDAGLRDQPQILPATGWGFPL
jgi:hypothetical protein